MSHKFHQAEQARINRQWDTQSWNNKIIELSGKTVGILGYGAVGKAVAARAEAFGMTVIASARESTGAVQQPVGAPERVQLEELMSKSQFLIVVAPITTETRGVVDRRRLNLLPKGAFVVVISRGGIVDEEALADLIEDGSIVGAAIDATAVEPLPLESRLWKLPGVILTPHSSALSAELFEARRMIFESQLERFLQGDELCHVLDMNAGY